KPFFGTIYDDDLRVAQASRPRLSTQPRAGRPRHAQVGSLQMFMKHAGSALPPPQRQVNDLCRCIRAYGEPIAYSVGDDQLTGPLGVFAGPVTKHHRSETDV